MMKNVDTSEMIDNDDDKDQIHEEMQNEALEEKEETIEEKETIVEEAHVPKKEGQKKQREFVEMMEIAITVDEDTIKRSTNDANSTRNEEWDTAKLNDL